MAQSTPKKDYQYEVEVVPLHGPDGGDTPFYGTRRTDTKAFLGLCSDQYTVLQNGSLFDAAEEAFDARGMGKWTRSITIEAGGARVYGTYDFKDALTEVKRDDIVGLRLTVTNSFDCSMRASIDVGLLRLVCTNGMTTTMNGISMSQKHTSTLNPKFIADSMDDVFKGYQQTTQELRQMQSIQLDQNAGHNIIKRLAHKDVYSLRTADRISEVWDKPRYQQDESRTLFNVYNAITQHLTHDVSGRKYELAYESNKDAYKHLRKATLDSGYLEAMVQHLVINN